MKRRRVRALLGALWPPPSPSRGGLPRTPPPRPTASAESNWADARDNYVDGWVIPTGLTASDSYSTVYTKADGILAGFQSLIGANTVRLPINPQSVNSTWWASYKAAFDSALAKA